MSTQGHLFLGAIRQKNREILIEKKTKAKVEAIVKILGPFFLFFLETA